MKILISDDSKTSRDVIRYLIQKQLQSQICEASNGIDALSIIQNDKIDILITDIKMPKMNGLELIEEAHKLRPNLQIIVLSAFGNFEYAKKALQTGVTNYLLKPINANEFSKTLTSVVSNFNSIKSLNIWAVFDQTVEIKTNIQAELPEALQQYCALFLIASDCRTIVNTPDIDRIITNIYPLSTMRLTNDSKYIILVNKKDNFNKISCCKIYEKINEIENFSLFVKSFDQSLESFKHCYSEIKDTDENTFFWGINPGFYFLDEKNDNKEKNITSFLHDAEALGKQIANCDPDANKHIEKLFNNMKDGNISSKQCKYIVTEMIKNLFLCMPTQIPLQKIIESIYINTTLESLKQNLYHLTEQIVDLSECNFQNTNHKQVIRAALQIIHNEYMHNLNRDDIAFRLYMSCSYFSHLFKNETGENFTSYLNNYRLEKAAEFLKKTDCNIAYIAKSVGFLNYPYFCAQFKKKYNLTCIQYRDSYFK